MRIICIDRALGNQAWVQVTTRTGSLILHTKMTMQPSGLHITVHPEGDAYNRITARGAGIHRGVLLYIKHYHPQLKREAYAAHMEWEC